MDPVIWETDPPRLREPVLVASFSGWNDAASAASTALRAIAGTLDTELIARIDPEEFFDFQANRPLIRLREGASRTVEWPQNLIVAAHAPDASRDLLLISGTEPSVRWRTFCRVLLDVADSCGVERMITFGALAADVAHTRPVPITGLATEKQLVAELGFEDVSYEGPTGIVGVLHHAAKERDLPAASLWAAVPHYAAAIPNPKAALALLRRLEGLLGIAIDAAELEDAASTFEQQVSKAVAASPDVRDLVTQLEQQQDEVGELTGEVPSGDAIARELQEYLRRQTED